WSDSLPLGVARVAASFKGGAPVTPKDRTRVVDVVRRELEEAASVAEKRGFDRAVGTSGTIEDLAMALAIERGAAPMSVNGYVMHIDEVAGLDHRLWEMPAGERAAVAGFDPRRADIMHVGSALVLAAMEVFGAEELTVGT